MGKNFCPRRCRKLCARRWRRMRNKPGRHDDESRLLTLHPAGTEQMKADLQTTSHRGDTVEAYETSVVRAIRHMKEHLAEPLDLDALAQIAAISKFHLVRVFDETTGTTPHHFLSCLRVQRAKELLLQSETTITDVCLEVGYNSLGTFSKTFSELVGLSPQEFRAMPKRLTAKQFTTAIWRYLAARKKISGPTIEGVVEGPRRPKGFTFVGTFT